MPNERFSLPVKDSPEIRLHIYIPEQHFRKKAWSRMGISSVVKFKFLNATPNRAPPSSVP
jgi:hypothetical protein